MRRKIVILIVFLFIALVAAAVAAGYWALGHRGFRALEAANQAYAKADWPEARRNYSWYLARQPDDVEILLRYAEVCEKVLEDRQEMLRGAAQAYLRVATLRETDRDAALKAAEFCEQHGLWVDLDYCTSFLLKRYPEDMRFEYLKALAAQRLGDTNGAVERYQKLAALPSCPPEVYGALAILLAQQGLAELADRDLNQAIERDPKNAQLLVQRARYNLDRGQLDAADQDIQAAKAIDPSPVEILLASAQLKLARKDWEGAAADANAVLGAEPSEEAYIILSRANFQRGKTEETADALSNADPTFLADHPTLYMILADLQLELERFDDAQATIATYRAAYPEHLAAFDYLEARELLKRGKPKEAAKRLEIAVEKAPDLQPARLQLILAYLQSDRKELARITLISHLQAYPSDEQAKGIWEAFFGSTSPEQATARAEELLKDENANSRALMLAANQLRQSVSSAADAQAAADLVRRLLENAVAQEPGAPEPFRDLMSYYLARKELTQAEALLERARTNGMKPQVLSFAEAAIALSQNDLPRAKKLAEEDLARADFSSDEADDWARLFASQNQLQVSLDLLQKYASRESDESVRLGLEVNSIGYALLAGDLDRALTLVREVEPRIGGDTGLVERLAEEKLRIAEVFLQRRSPENLQTAEAIVSEVRSADDTNVRAKLLEARLLTQRVPPELEKAEALCATLRQGEAVDPQVYLLSADIARGRGLPQRALEFAAKANELSPSEIPVQLSLAQAQLQSGQHAEAIVALDRLLALQPHNPLVLDLLARAHAGAGHVDEAQRFVAQLEAETTASPESAKALGSLRTWIAICAKDWSTAEQLARAQYEADSTDYGALRFLIAALDGQGRRAESEPIIRSAAETAKTPELYTDLGRWYLGATDPESLSQASTAFTSALSANANYPPALLGLANVARLGNNVGTAIGLYDRYLKTVPDDAEVLLQKATLLATMPNRRDEALDAVNRSVELTERPENLYLRGTLYLVRNNYEEAARDLDRAAELRGGASAQIDVELAYAYLGLGDKEKARAHYDMAKQKVAQGEKLDLPGRLDQLSSLLTGSSS
ncbi:MAG: tetratricopeptide repeat protein [Candidatus Hydrogenedentes bacterium]|nr:tetratricopeptide repeat protein [Candidatus Hydrogenedentota bacterium]